MLSLVDKTQLLRIFIWVFVALALPLMLLFGLPGLFYSFVISILLSPLLLYITFKIGSAAGRLYSGSASPKSDRDLLLIELEKIRIQFGRREFDEALKGINVFNRLHPNMPEALYLKAHILWDGFCNKKRAISYLNKVMQYADPGSEYYQWALNFQEELEAVDDEKMKTSPVKSD